MVKLCVLRTSIPTIPAMEIPRFCSQKPKSYITTRRSRADIAPTSIRGTMKLSVGIAPVNVYSGSVFPCSLSLLAIPFEIALGVVPVSRIRFTALAGYASLNHD